MRCSPASRPLAADCEQRPDDARMVRFSLKRFGEKAAAWPARRSTCQCIKACVAALLNRSHGRCAIFAVRPMNEAHGLYALQRLLPRSHASILQRNKNKIRRKCLGLSLLNWR